MRVGKRVHYSGRVQGVGFRYTTHRLAQGCPVSGYVRNLSDGRVEVVAEGEAEDVERFLAAVAATMSDYIDNQSVGDVSVQNLNDFVIRA